jgi:hypothetical protein
MFWRNCLLLICMLGALTAVGRAQGVPESTPDPAPVPTPNVVFNTTYGIEEAGMLSDAQFFNWWRILPAAGDTIQIEMTGLDGLAPLIGLLSPSGELIARSDGPPDGAAPPNGTTRLRHTFESDGRYTIVATRVGNAEGTTTGAYTLRTALVDRPEPPNEHLEYEFRCDELLATRVLGFQVAEDAGNAHPDGVTEFYRLTVFGLDGLQPVIRARSSAQETTLDCTDFGVNLVGAEVTLPDGTHTTVGEDTSHVAQLTLRNSSLDDGFGIVSFAIGATDGQPGRYLAVLEGLAIEPRADIDELTVHIGSLALDAPVTILALADPATRLDPMVAWTPSEPGPGGEYTWVLCDDLGTDPCAPAQTGLSIVLPDRSFAPGRLDAGVTIPQAAPGTFAFQIGSRETRTSGAYTLVFMGELPR